MRHRAMPHTLATVALLAAASAAFADAPAFQEVRVTETIGPDQELRLQVSCRPGFTAVSAEQLFGLSDLSRSAPGITRDAWAFTLKNRVLTELIEDRSSVLPPCPAIAGVDGPQVLPPRGSARHVTLLRSSDRRGLHSQWRVSSRSVTF
jgi:hypothetical protein